MMIEEFTAGPLFGLLLTLAAYSAGQFLYKKTRISFLHPVLTASGAIIAVLLLANISLPNYQKGGSMISLLLGPAAVSLGVPLYRQLGELKKNGVIIICSIAAGSAASMVSVILISKALGLPEEIILSLIPKSVTTPIAVEASERLGGLPSITAISVIITGIAGAVTVPFMLKLLGVRQAAARGTAMGTSSHAIGTARALEMGETEGAVSSLAIGVAGIITVAAAPALTAILL